MKYLLSNRQSHLANLFFYSLLLNQSIKTLEICLLSLSKYEYRKKKKTIRQMNRYIV